MNNGALPGTRVDFWIVAESSRFQFSRTLAFVISHSLVISPSTLVIRQMRFSIVKTSARYVAANASQ
jgi:hypothetical protein